MAPLKVQHHRAAYQVFKRGGCLGNNYGNGQISLDSDEVPHQRYLLKMFIQCAIPIYAHTLGVRILGEDSGNHSTVSTFANQGNSKTVSHSWLRSQSQRLQLRP